MKHLDLYLFLIPTLRTPTLSTTSSFILNPSDTDRNNYATLNDFDK